MGGGGAIGGCASHAKCQNSVSVMVLKALDGNTYDVILARYSLIHIHIIYATFTHFQHVFDSAINWCSTVAKLVWMAVIPYGNQASAWTNYIQ